MTDTYTYSVYGAVTSHTGSSSTPFMFNGRDGVMTDASGLYYLRARYYSPELMRFINEDTYKGTLSSSQTLNNYIYANGNPVSMVDPEGMFAWIVAGAIVGGLIGGGAQIISNLSQGKEWYSDVAGATVGGALNGGILAATGVTSLLATGIAALAGGAAQSVINEGEDYVTGQKRFDQNDLESSGQSIAFNTAKNSALNFIGDYIGAKLIPVNSGWFKPQSWTSFLSKSYGQKIIAQNLAGGVLSYIESMSEYTYDTQDTYNSCKNYSLK